jgi:hypothetical protein
MNLIQSILKEKAMKMMKLTLLLMYLTSSIIFGRVHIVLYDCSGSFLGKNSPSVLRTGALQKINELIQSINQQDTIIFMPIRENSTVSSLRQIIFTKDAEKRIFDKTAERNNSIRMKTFAKAVMNEINRDPSPRTDIVSALNFAGSIAKLSKDATIIILSDGDDNINGEMFNDLKGIKIYHLFVYTPSSTKINKLLEKWRTLYSKLGARFSVVQDAQSSLNYKINGEVK